MAFRPTDPGHTYYLTNCFVCNQVPPEGEKHIYGYGGTVCPSCRAFFRRAHQKTRNPLFICKEQSECTINVDNRRKCKKCRYNLCLRAGMKPGLLPLWINFQRVILTMDYFMCKTQQFKNKILVSYKKLKCSSPLSVRHNDWSQVDCSRVYEK